MIRAAGSFLAGMNSNPSLPMTHTPLTVLAAAIAKSRLRGLDFSKARARTKVRRQDRDKVSAPARAYAEVSRSILVPALGGSWSAAWIPAGWDQNTLGVPKPAEQVVELIHSLTDFLTDHPELGSDKYKVTAAESRKQADALEKALEDLRKAKSAQRVAREVRDEADEALSEMVRAATKELELLLKPDDARWMDFIDQVPADTERPEVVTELVVEAGAPGELDVEWEAGVRADRYLVEVKVEGVDTEFRRLITVRDESATLIGLPPGKEVAVRVVAANDAGESAPSAVASATVPAIEKAA